MFTDIDIKSKYSVIASVTTMVLSVMFVVTACSTFISAREDSNQKTPSATVSANSMTSEAIAPKNDVSNTPPIDKVMDDWEKARATYLRTLDYAQVDQQNDDHDEYLLKSNLIESRYHIKNSETAMYVEKDFRKAVVELREADQRFKQAVKTANSAELSGLKATESDLEGLLKNAELSVKNECVNPQSTSYHQVEAKIENLIANL